MTGGTGVGSRDRIVSSRAESRLGELYERHALAAARLAYILTGDRVVAEDIVQEAFVRIVGRFKYRKPPDVFDAYLRRAVINLAKNHFRHQSLRRSHAARQRQTQVFSPDETADIDAGDELRRALLELPHRQRVALVLRYFSDLSEQQIADAMGCSAGAVKSTLYRGLKTLRRTLRDDMR